MRTSWSAYELDGVRVERRTSWPASVRTCTLVQHPSTPVTGSSCNKYIFLFQHEALNIESMVDPATGAPVVLPFLILSVVPAFEIAPYN